MVTNILHTILQNSIFSTLFIGQNLIRLTTVDSTNTYLKNLLSKSEPLPEGTVIMADHQFAGRGQVSNTWKSAPGKNLTFSILLYPSFLLPIKQFSLNMAVSVAISNVLRGILGSDLTIKWPNDIYFKNRKIGGILIENTVSGNQLSSSIIGVGINVNQLHFEEELAEKACSMVQILQKNVDLMPLLAEICKCVESAYFVLRSGKYNKIKESYVDKLYRINVPARYQTSAAIFEGIITGVSDTGLLSMDRGGKQFDFNFKEINFLN